MGFQIIRGKKKIGDKGWNCVRLQKAPERGVPSPRGGEKIMDPGGEKNDHGYPKHWVQGEINSS